MNKIKHLAVIMDGNKRWSKINNKNILDGYTQGVKKIHEIISFCIKEKIPNLTIFALSSENFKRQSVNIIFQLIENSYKDFLEIIEKDKEVKIRVIGEKKLLSNKLIKIFNDIESITKNYDKLKLNIAFNYGTFDELVSIFNNIKKSQSALINEEQIRNNMYLKNIPDPDILIRTGGFQRLSNFILLNLSYTELYFTNTLWPDLSIDELKNTIEKFENTKRNYGL
jgi:undecaprenyl diphosphate synthase